MSTELHCYDYVNQPFELVRRALLADPQTLFQRATSSRGQGRLHVGIGKLDVAAEIEIAFGRVTESHASLAHPTTLITLSWRGRRTPSLVPVMTAELAIFPLSPTETQLTLTGSYQPPLGVIGEAVDAIALRRLAQSSVAAFVRELATYLRSNLSAAQALA